MSLWVFDPNGRALVNSLAYPQPDGLNFSDRDYFRAHVGTGNRIFELRLTTSGLHDRRQGVRVASGERDVVQANSINIYRT